VLCMCLFAPIADPPALLSRPAWLAAGWKEKPRSTTEYNASEIVLCSKGEVSYWTDGVRSPADPEACEPCLNSNKYAPRAGMRSCQACRAGTYPTKSDVGLAGNDQCSQCTGNTYRPASSARWAAAQAVVGGSLCREAFIPATSDTSAGCHSPDLAA